MKISVAVLGILLIAFVSVYGRDSLPCDRSNNYRLEKGLPAIFFEFERFGGFEPTIETTVKSARIERGKDVWLRLRNNSCWDIKFLGMFSGPNFNGEIIWTSPQGTSTPIGNADYIAIEANGKYIPQNMGDARVGISLASGTSLLFPVRKEHLDRGNSIYIDFNYGWEVASIGLEHRISFRRSLEELTK